MQLIVIIPSQCFVKRRFHTIEGSTISTLEENNPAEKEADEADKSNRNLLSVHTGGGGGENGDSRLSRPRSSSTCSSSIYPNSPPCNGRSVTTPRKQEINLAITLVTISFLFIACSSVKVITDVYELLCPNTFLTANGKRVCESESFIEVMTSLAILSSCVNSALNFLIYMLRGKKFRDLFLETYCCRRSSGGGGRVASVASRSVVYSIRRNQEQHHVGGDTANLTTATSGYPMIHFNKTNNSRGAGLEDQKGKRRRLGLNLTTHPAAAQKTKVSLSLSADEASTKASLFHQQHGIRIAGRKSH